MARREGERVGDDEEPRPAAGDTGSALAAYVYEYSGIEFTPGPEGFVPTRAWSYRRPKLPAPEVRDDA